MTFHLSYASWHLSVEGCVGWQVMGHEHPTPPPHTITACGASHKDGPLGTQQVVFILISRGSTGASASGNPGWHHATLPATFFPTVKSQS